MTTQDRNMLYHGDNFEWMRGIRENSVDLIYADPPFNTRRSLGDYNDNWDGYESQLYFHEGLEDIAGLSGQIGLVGYLKFMNDRLKLMERILKPEGSIYLHVDNRGYHYLKILMDMIFGHNRFRNDITWKRSNAVAGNTIKKFNSVQDRILFYSGGGALNRKGVAKELEQKTIDLYVYEDERGKYLSATLTQDPKRGRPNLTYEWQGVTRTWQRSREGMDELLNDNRIHFPDKEGGVPRKKVYLHENQGIMPSDVWDDVPQLSSQSAERTGYATQKPLCLLKRIISASSNRGDLVLDPFMGSGTTLVAAKELGRDFIGIDENPEAVATAAERLGLVEKHKSELQLLKESVL